MLPSLLLWMIFFKAFNNILNFISCISLNSSFLFFLFYFLFPFESHRHTHLLRTAVLITAFGTLLVHLNVLFIPPTHAWYLVMRVDGK